MTLLADVVDRKFIDGIEAEFSRRYPGADGVRERIADTISRANRYGITHSADVEWFVNLDLARGYKWELHPDMDWALEILDSVADDIAGRRYRLEKRIRRWDGDGD